MKKIILNLMLFGATLTGFAQVNFTTQQIISLSTDGARSVYAADLDGDGDIDVLSASELDNKIVWYSNNGHGNFGNAQVITNVANGASSVYTADIDDDGDIDIVAASVNDDKIAWYVNNGLGNFSSQQVITTSTDGAHDVFVADLDNDGDMDVLSASYLDNKIAWYANNGSGYFGNQQTITTGANGAWSVYAVDIDNDGDIDVLSASYGDGKIAWYENDGNGNFGSQQVITTGNSGAYCVYAADINNDGNMDVLASFSGTNKVVWYENDGNCNFTQHIITADADGVNHVYAADLDNDGDMDVLSALYSGNKICWYENDGDGNFGNQKIISSYVGGALSVYATDLDGDGKKDVLSASYDDDKIAWYRNNGCLLAFYPFNGNANDASGNGHNGDTTGHAPVPEPDRFDTVNAAYHFNTNQYVYVFDTSGNFDLSGNLSVSLWFKYDTLLNDTNILFYAFENDTATNTQMAIVLNKMANAIMFAYDTAYNSPVIDTVSYHFTDGMWYHVVVTKALDTAYCNYNIYINGDEVCANMDSLPYVSGSNFQAYTINSGVQTNAYNGIIDDVILYQCVLDPWSVDSLYHTGGWPIYNGTQCDNFYVTVNVDTADCGQSNGYAEIDTVYGGSGDYIVTWSTGDTTEWVDSLAAGTYSVIVTDTVMGCTATQYFTVPNASGPQITIDLITPVSCNGGHDGAIDLTVSGADDIQWSNGATTEDIAGLPAGYYDIVATDANGCFASQTIEVTEPPALQLAFSVTDAFCGASDGAITVTATGGMPSYDFTWSSGGTSGTESGLMAGTYYVTVTDANGCVATGMSSVSNTGAPVITVDSIVPASCNGQGAIYISVSGNTSSVTYQWSNGATTEDLTGVQAEAYSLTVTESGCMAVLDTVVPGIQPQIQPICLVSVDSVTGTNLIVWEKQQTSGIAYYKIYRETSVPNHYQYIDSVLYDNMSEYNDMVASPFIRSWRYKISAVDSCGNESALSASHKTIHLTMNVGLGGAINLIWDDYEGFNYTTYYIYRHTATNGWEVIDSLPNYLHSYTDIPPEYSGLWYYVSVKAPYSCVPTSTDKATGGPYSQSTSNIEDDEGIIVTFVSNSSLSRLKIYPNPNTGQFTIEFPANKKTEISGYDVSGRLIYQATTNKAKTNIDIRNLDKGIYIFKLTNNRETSSFRIVVQ